MDFGPYCRVCINDKHQTSQGLHIHYEKDFIHNPNRNFNYWCNRRDGYSSLSLAEGGEYHHRMRSQCCSPQRRQQKPWQTINKPGLSYRRRCWKPSTVRSWNEGARMGSLPSRVTSSKKSGEGTTAGTSDVKPRHIKTAKTKIPAINTTAKY